MSVEKIRTRPINAKRRKSHPIGMMAASKNTKGLVLQIKKIRE